MQRTWLARQSAAKAALLLPLALVFAGCNNGYYHPIGPPPADTITFSSASTQGWLQQYGTGYVPANNHSRNGDTAYGIATDPQGNVIVLDETFGAFSGFMNNNSAEFAVVKFDDAGNRLWTQQFGTGAGDFPNAVTTDADGNIYVAGFTYGAFPGFTNSNGAQQSVVIKLNSSGQTQWIQQTGSTGPSQATGLAVDTQGNLIVGGVNVVSGSNRGRVQRGYISKLSGTSGAVVWNQGNSTTGVYYFVTSVSADSSNNVIAVGNFQGTGSSTSTIYMAAKLNGTNGNLLWQAAPVTYSFGNQNLIYTQVALDAQGDVFLGGLDPSSGYGRCAVAELANASGSQQWQQEFGAAQSCIPGNVATDSAGNVLMAGNMVRPFFTSTNPSRQNDVFVAKLTTGGQAVWLQQFGTGKDIPNATSSASALVFVATDSQNHADIAGTTTGAFPNFTNPNSANELFVTQFGP